eukprot:Nitzschia sp. Nitz4//scaffold11_size288233//56681//59155//NITZ4_000744-RA/size288233-processed-gene-0.145-mRNA-1//1//CDS//3329533984//109//frame0
MSATKGKYDAETEMERIAREAREFRESEAKRIAEEKAEARRLQEEEKAKRRERIALQSGQFLEEAAKERLANSPGKLSPSLKKSFSNEDASSLVTDVQGKAKLLFAKEKIEREKLEQERNFVDKKSKSKDSAEYSENSADPVTPNKEVEEDDMFFFDANSNLPQSDLKKSEASPTGRNHESSLTESSISMGAVLVEHEDASPEKDKPTVTIVSPQKGDKSEPHNVSPSADSSMSLGAVLVAPDDSQPLATQFETPAAQVANKSILESKESRQSVYYDARQSYSKSISADSMTTPAGNLARELFGTGRDVMTNQGNIDTPRDLFPGHGDERSLVAHRARPAMTKKSKDASSKDGGSNDLFSNHVQEAEFELPFEYLGEDGFKVLQTAEAKVALSMPSSKVGGRLSGSMEGKSSLVPGSPASNASGSVTLNYQATPMASFSTGVTTDTNKLDPLVKLGVTVYRGGSLLGATISDSANAILGGMDRLQYSLCFKHLFRNSSWTVSSDLSPKQDLSLAVSNKKLSSSCSMNLREPSKMSFRTSLYPQITEDKELDLTGEWSKGVWQVGATLVQSLHTRLATVGLGVRLYSTRGLEFLFSWSRGNASIRIPILVAKGMQNVHIGQVLYFSFVSFLIQEGIAEMWGWKVEANAKKSLDEAPVPTTYSKATAIHDAKLQQSLMERQAKRKVRDEESKSGLVIRKAVYKVEGGDEWDVTTPLQFWVNQGVLSLPAKSKNELLGFYDLALVDKEDDKTDTAASSTKFSWERWLKESWVEMLDLPTLESTSKSDINQPKPLLKIVYEYQGKKFEATVQDEQEVVLPGDVTVRRP